MGTPGLLNLTFAMNSLTCLRELSHALPSAENICLFLPQPSACIQIQLPHAPPRALLTSRKVKIHKNCPNFVSIIIAYSVYHLIF
jgi:hypothetical protein